MKHFKNLSDDQLMEEYRTIRKEMITIRNINPMTLNFACMYLNVTTELIDRGITIQESKDGIWRFLSDKQAST
jgi:hypothetical protein